MTILPPDCAPVNRPQENPAGGLERTLRFLSVATMLMTVPQILTIWIGGNVGGVSIISWASYLFSACLWFVYGIQKRDKTIYLACIGWIVLDSAVVIGVIARS
jgi:uncharacterized protein with PQ loop repeat